MSKLLLIDGNAIIHRAYHAMPGLTTPKGEPIGAVQGFLNIFLKLIDTLDPTHIAVAWDRKEKTFRHKKYKNYQSHRPAVHDDLVGQFGKVKQALDTFGVVQLEKAGYEADDIIGTLAKKALASKEIIQDVVIVTGDKDQLQLVNEKVKVYMPAGGFAKAVLYGVEEVKEKMGVEPERIIDLKAFMGDSSDNYPGIPGIGPKTAVNLIKEFGGYKETFKNIERLPDKTKDKLLQGKELGDVSFELASIKCDMPIEVEFSDLQKWNKGSRDTLEVFKKFGFNSLTKRVEQQLIPKNKSLNKDQIESLVVKIAKKLKGKQYAIRGSASLFLQGVEMKVDDIDVICDKDTAHFCNKVFKNVISEVKWSENRQFKSYFGSFNLDGALVEIMGNWQIKEKRGWSDIYDASENMTTTTKIKGEKVNLTTMDTEADMFAAMQRWNALKIIKNHMLQSSQNTLF